METWTEPHPRRLPTEEEALETRLAIERLDNEIQDATNQIRALQSHLESVQTARARKISFIAPFRRIPQELLARIAEFCIEEGDSPAILNAVCSSFRSAVNGMQKLWCTIHITPARHNSSQPERSEEREVQGRLSRRGMTRDSRPLSITRSSYREGNFCMSLDHLEILLKRTQGSPVDLSMIHPDLIHTDIIEKTTLHSSQLRSLAIVLSPNRYYIPIMELPQLEKLQIHSNHLNSSVRHILKIVNDKAPKMVTLYLELHASTDFPLAEVARHQFCYRLRNLYLSTGSKGPSDPSAPVIDLPELETLTLIGKPWQLAYMTLPNLLSLTIIGGTKKRNQKVIPPHFPTSITKLHLDHVRFAAYTSTAVLLPNLTHLDLRYPSIESTLDPHFMMPALETMRMDSITYNSAFRSAPEQSALSALFSGEGVLQDLYSLRRLLLEEIHLETTSCTVFRGIPALEEWELRGCSLPHDLAETLAGKATGRDTNLLARLERLHVKKCWSMSETAEQVEERVRATSAQFRPNLQVFFTENQTEIILAPAATMSSYVYELPTTGNVVFSEFILDQTGQYSHAIGNATVARTNLRAVLKESKRTDEGEKDYLRIVKVIDDYLPHLYAIMDCVDSDDLSLKNQPAFSWRSTFSANLLNNSPRQTVMGLHAELAFTLLTYGSALANLAASCVTSLGQYERERAITDALRKVKDEKLNFAVQLLLRAAGVFAHTAEVVIPQWERYLSDVGSVSNPLTTLKPVDLSKELVLALSKFSMAEAQTLAVRKLMSRSAYDSTLTPGPPLPKSHPSPKLIVKLSLFALESYASACSLAKSARGGIQGGTEVTKDLTRWLADETSLTSALSHKWLGVEAGEQSSTSGKAGEAVGFLQWAKSELEALKDGGHGIAGLSRKAKRKERVAEEIASTMAFLSHYKKLNDTIHFEPVLPVATLQSMIPTGKSAVEMKLFTPPPPSFRSSRTVQFLAQPPEIVGEEAEVAAPQSEGVSPNPTTVAPRPAYF